MDTDDLLTSEGVADLLGLHGHRAVSVYRDRYPDFPAPVIDHPRCKLWLRPDVERWRRRGQSPETQGP